MRNRQFVFGRYFITLNWWFKIPQPKGACTVFDTLIMTHYKNGLIEWNFSANIIILNNLFSILFGETIKP